MKQILGKLDYYRNFPRFQLERHFDVFLINYIPQIINFYNNTNYSVVFPEFPVRKKLLTHKYKSDMESVAFDYAIFDTSNKSIAIVELKTETESNKLIQDKYLATLSQSVTCSDLIEFINDRVNHGGESRTKRKYQFLKEELVRTNCLDCSRELLQTYKISPSNNKLNDDDYYSFKQIANEVRFSDEKNESWLLICKYLEKWDQGI